MLLEVSAALEAVMWAMKREAKKGWSWRMPVEAVNSAMEVVKGLVAGAPIGSMMTSSSSTRAVAAGGAALGAVGALRQLSKVSTSQLTSASSLPEESPVWVAGVLKAFHRGQVVSMAVWPLGDFPALAQLMQEGGQLHVMEPWCGALAHFRW